jgi:hypothetical protein
MGNTKPCPSCNTRIEKDGGCNHMSCTKCNFQFCWICGHEWETHNGEGYDCNTRVNFDTKYNLEKCPEAKRGVAQKAARFVGHYQEHVQSQRNEARKKETALVKLANLYINNGIRGDAASEFAMRILSAVETARSVLIWSYPYAFFLPAGPTSGIFQYLQAQLCMYVDELTDCIESKPNSPMKTIER